MKLSSVAIEITRRCNIKCEHCLRGEAQNKNIKLSYIDSLFNQVELIHHLTITGGEPSLKPDIIIYIAQKLFQYNVSLGYFYIATNGVKITEDFILACGFLYRISFFKENCTVEVSNDEFHIKEKQYEDKLLHQLPYYQKRFKDEGYSYPTGYDIHREGRGAFIPRAKKYTGAYSINTKYDFTERGVVYLNVDGEIVNGCDWSYENQYYHVLCKVDELTEFYNKLKNEV